MSIFSWFFGRISAKRAAERLFESSSGFGVMQTAMSLIDEIRTLRVTPEEKLSRLASIAQTIGQMEGDYYALFYERWRKIEANFGQPGFDLDAQLAACSDFFVTLICMSQRKQRWTILLWPLNKCKH